MSDTPVPTTGAVVWTDLTVENAAEVSEFYAKVVGWKASPVDMGEYSDFNMTDPQTDLPVVGICHKRGPNASQPSCWMMYVTVADIDRSAAACEAQGGKVLIAPRPMGKSGRLCVIEDPAGATLALFEQAEG